SVTTEGVGASLTIEGSVPPAAVKADCASDAGEAVKAAADATSADSGLSHLRLGDIDFLAVDPIRYEISFSNVGECVHAAGTLQTQLRTTCVRCLNDFEFDLASTVDESFFFVPSEDEHGDPYPVIDDSGKVDIEPLLRESLLVELPFASVCDSDCQGLCMKCGMDLNGADCECTDEVDANHPFAGLRDLMQ
ncbi:MAG: YceD family protein, partial [Coriobacteriia bacterium]|nr:YceD family protein [Coriobacteriia bacterium]